MIRIRVRVRVMIFLLVYLGTSMLKKHVCETGKYLSAFETAIVENSLENISQYDACVISVRNFEKEISEHLISLGLDVNKIIPISKFDSE